MFILATADIAVSWNVLFRHTTSLYTGNTTSTVLQRIYPKFLIYIVNKSVFLRTLQFDSQAYLSFRFS